MLEIFVVFSLLVAISTIVSSFGDTLQKRVIFELKKSWINKEVFGRSPLYKEAQRLLDEQGIPCSVSIAVTREGTVEFIVIKMVESDVMNVRIGATNTLYSFDGSSKQSNRSKFSSVVKKVTKKSGSKVIASLGNFKSTLAC